MDYYLRRERRRLIEDLVDLQYAEDLQRQYRHENFRRHRWDYEEDQYRDHHRRREEYCLVTLTYRPRHAQEKRADEIMVIQHHRTVFKGCLYLGDQFTFKAEHREGQSKMKFQCYINDKYEEEISASCKHQFDRETHFFRIENISLQRENRISEHRTPLTSSRSSSVSSEDQSDQQQESKINQSFSSVPPSPPHQLHDVFEHQTSATELSNDEQQSEEEPFILSPSSSTKLPTKRTYGPPQLSTVLSLTESLDSPSGGVRERTIGDLSYAFPSIQQQSTTQSYRESFSFDLNHVDLTNSEVSSFEPSLIEEGISESLDNASDMAIANNATQLLLTQLGIMRQQQIERPDVTSANIRREKGNVESFILVYLHASYPDEILIEQFRSLVNFMKIFSDIDDCVAFVNTIFTERIILIVSKAFSHPILPRIEALQQIFQIYVICETAEEIDHSFGHSKTLLYSTDFNQIYEQMNDGINKITRDLIIYIGLSSNAMSIDGLFGYFQLLYEVLLDQTDPHTDNKSLVHLSQEEYDGNVQELTLIDEFKKTYGENQAIYWFTRPCFLSKMLNKALRIPEVSILYPLRFFIQDLYHQIEAESTSQAITVYLAQTIQEKDLNDLQTNILVKDLFYLPQFLAAATDLSRAARLAREIPVLTEEYIPLVIRIDIPEGLKCANIHSPRHTIDEDNDVLLNLGIMGRIVKIEKVNVNDELIVCLHLTAIKCENQRNIQQFLEVKRAEMKSFSPLCMIIKLMLAMNRQSAAEQMIEAMVNDQSIKSDVNLQTSIGACCHILASAHRDVDNCQRALELYLLSVDLFTSITPSNAVELSPLFSQIGALYSRLTNYEKALESYQKALDIQLHSNSPDLYFVSNMTNNLGMIYLKQGNFPEAIKFFERTIKILQQVSEPHDTELALTYDNIGDTYLSQAKFEEALVNYRQSLEIQERLVPQSPQVLAVSHQTIGNLCMKLNRWKEAAPHLKRALEYMEQYLPLTHSSFPLLYNNIGLMYYRDEQYSEALTYYLKGLDMASISLPADHSLVAVLQFNIGLVYTNEEKFDQAIEMIEKSTAQFLKTLPADHPEVMENLKYLESIRQKQVLKDIFDENVVSF